MSGNAVESSEAEEAMKKSSNNDGGGGAGGLITAEENRTRSRWGCAGIVFGGFRLGVMVGGTGREASADNVRQEQGEDSKQTRVQLSVHENKENEILQRSQDKRLSEGGKKM